MGVQIIGLPWQEELVLRGMKEVEMAIAKNKDLYDKLNTF